MTTEERKLIEKIRSAFAGVILCDGISLNMTEYNDSGGCMPEFLEKAVDDERIDWQAIPDKTLEQFTVTFSFTDLKGFRFYIPAYMIWTISNHRTSDSIIADFTIYAINPSHYLFEKVPFLQWFTEEQVVAMTEFLNYSAQDEEGSLDADAAKENLIKIQKAQQADAGNPATPVA